MLLDRYGLTDPALAVGAFSDPTLQSLYTSLVAQGSLSVGDALKVGAAIEELDILDLQARLLTTDNADIQQVYNNLLSGSNNHLQAFTSALLTQTGETYQPQYMSAELYASALSASVSNSGQGSQGQGGGQGQGNQASLSTSLRGTVSAYEWGTLTIQTDDGTVMGIQLGNSSYVESLGFAPQVGEALTVTGFPNEEGLFSAISISLDATGQVFTFRESTGRPSWAGGKGGGNIFQPGPGVKKDNLFCGLNPFLLNKFDERGQCGGPFQ